eukprot:COSAG02_NODE_25311_length_662_cov_1.177620_1_plen_132_part_10
MTRHSASSGSSDSRSGAGADSEAEGSMRARGRRSDRALTTCERALERDLNRSCCSRTRDGVLCTQRHSRRAGARSPSVAQYSSRPTSDDSIAKHKDGPDLVTDKVPSYRFFVLVEKRREVPRLRSPLSGGFK